MACHVPARAYPALAAFCIAFCFLPRIFGEDPAFAPEDGTALFRHIVLLGASVTAGFEITEPLGGPKTPQYRFANFIEGALAGSHEPVETQASALLFFKPEETMERQITATVAMKPSLVIGIDALFWFCYGPGLTSEQRLTRFEAGLRLLERIAAPLVVGDLPDASPAAGGMLSKNELPDPAVLAQCNERLKAWVAAHRNVVLIPLNRMMTAAYANTALTLGGTTWAAGKSGALIREDRLHPSRHALAALAIEALDAAARIGAAVPPPNSICREVQTVYDRALARAGATAPEPK